MSPKLIVAALAIIAMPVSVQAQEPSASVTAAKRVAEAISSDPAKIAIYCDIGKLGVQIEDANEAKDRKTADVLTQKMRELEKQLGPEYRRDRGGGLLRVRTIAGFARKSWSSGGL